MTSSKDDGLNPRDNILMSQRNIEEPFQDVMNRDIEVGRKSRDSAVQKYCEKSATEVNY